MFASRFKGFKSLSKQISDLTDIFSTIGCCEAIVNFLCSRFNVDREYYREWLCSRDVGDIAELVVLYLKEDVREEIFRELREAAASN